MKIVTVPKMILNPISLPGMGRSIELTDVPHVEIMEIQAAYARQELFIEFEEEPGNHLPVTQLWGNPHAPQITLFIR